MEKTKEENTKMPVGPLRRLCKKCGSLFLPPTKYTRFCPVCIEERYKHIIKKRSKSIKVVLPLSKAMMSKEDIEFDKTLMKNNGFSNVDISREIHGILKTQRRFNLKKYFKYIFTCTSCKEQFGSDSKDVNKVCPLCIDSKKRFGNISKRMMALKRSETPPEQRLSLFSVVTLLLISLQVWG